MIAGVGNCASAVVQGIEHYRGPNASAEAGACLDAGGGLCARVTAGENGSR